MGQYPNSHLDPPFWWRPAPRPKRFHDLEVLPTLARVGAAAWASDFARLSEDERNAVVCKMIAGFARYQARRAGRPDPILLEAPAMVPLRKEYGGDGRSFEDASREAKANKPRDDVYIASLTLAQIAEKHRAKLEALGIKIEVVPREELAPPKTTKTLVRKRAKG